MRYPKRETILALALALCLVSCADAMLDDIRKSATEAKQGEAPSILVFSLSGAAVTRERSIAIQLSGSAKASAWFLGESETEPAASSAAWIEGQAPSTFLLADLDGLHVVYAWAKSPEGGLSRRSSISVTLDRVAPAFLLANAGASTLTSPNASIDLSSTEEGLRWAVKEAPAAPAPEAPGAADSIWTSAKPATLGLSAGSGTKTIWAWAMDAAGNVSAASSIAVLYQAAADTPTITLAGPGYDATPSDTVAISLDGNAFAAWWLVRAFGPGETAADPALDDPLWTRTKPTQATLGADGTYAVYAWAKNDAGQLSAEKHFSITLDRVAPAFAMTRTSEATVSEASVSFSLGGESESPLLWAVIEAPASPTPSPPLFPGSEWRAEKPSSCALSSTSGAKTVWAWAMDGAHNRSEPRSITVLYQNPAQAPTFDLALASASTTNDPAVAFTVSNVAYATGWYVAAYAAGGSPAQPPAEAAWTGTKPSGLALSSDGSWEIAVWARNDASQLAKKTVAAVLDRVKPTMTFSRTSASPTSNGHVTFSLQPAGGVTDIASYLVKADSGTLGASEDWKASVAYLDMGAYGSHSLYAWAKDQAGNVSDPPLAFAVEYWPTPMAMISYGQSASGGSTLTTRDSFILTFDQEMEPSTLSFIGSTIGGIAPEQVAWQAGTTPANSKATVSAPAAEWTVGSGLAFTAACVSKKGIALAAPATATVNTFRGLCVAIRTPAGVDASDGNAGTAAAPMRNIGPAITKATALGYGTGKPAEIRVAQDGSAGTVIYHADWRGNTNRIVMGEGISVYGGHNQGDWGQRDPALYTTTIKDDSTSAGTDTSDPNCVIDCGSGLTSATAIDGFRLSIACYSYSCALNFHGGSAPLVSRCILQSAGGTAPSGFVYGVIISDSSPDIRESALKSLGGLSVTTSCGVAIQGASSPRISYCTIEGGRSDMSAGTNVYGLYLLGSAVRPTIECNTISAGMGSSTYGVYAYMNDGNCVLRNNVIVAAKGSAAMYGIALRRSAATMQNNTIVAGNAGQVNPSYGLHLYEFQSGDGKPKAENNIIVLDTGGTGCACVWEKDQFSDFSAFRYNDFHSPNVAGFTLYRDFDTSELSAVADVESALASDGCAGGNNLLENPGFVNAGGGDYSLRSDSVIRDSGINLSASFASDRSGPGTRGTSNWSIGAYEK